MKPINCGRMRPMYAKEVFFNIFMFLLRLGVISGCFYVIAIMISQELLVYFDLDRIGPAVILLIIAAALIPNIIKTLFNMIAFEIAWRKHVKITDGKEKIYPDITDDTVKSIVSGVVPKQLIAEDFKAATLVIRLKKNKGATSKYTDNKAGKRIDYTFFFYDNVSNKDELLAKGLLLGEPTPFTKLEGIYIETVPSDKCLKGFFKELSRRKFLLSSYNRFLYYLETSRKKK